MSKNNEPGALLLVLGVLNLLIMGAVGFKVAKAHASAAESSLATDAAKPEEIKSFVVALDPFVVNLNEPGSTTYLKVSFELEVASAGSLQRIERQTRQVRDDLLRYLSSLTATDTLGEVNKTQIKTNVRTRLNRLLGGALIKDVYLSNFVVH